ncbi:unnamed protein product [Litomosoides sigmodontis]|uniref:Thioredoxin domain-containing protein 17 n=1 Tax=Litomosoides sigmodontis TaxID=42156 RepID=A0A3P6UDG1_LITSI|nr:unnamed protein product [Litomosoides sigmodontis]
MDPLLRILIVDDIANMVFSQMKAEGLNELNELLKDAKCRTVIFFTSSKDDGKSWCPDCVQVEPIIEKVIKEISSSDDADLNLTFIECSIGPRTYWKDQTNAFRTDGRFKLKEIPTLLDYSNKAKRLSGEQCANELLVKELFLED